MKEGCREIRRVKGQREPRETLKERVTELWEQGKNDAEIAKATGYSKPRICTLRNELNLKTKHQPSAAKITNESREIRQKVKKLWEDGKTDFEISRALDIDRKRARYIRKDILQLDANRNPKQEQKNRRKWANSAWQGEKDDPVEEYVENGVKVQKCQPRAAHGAWPMRRY